MKNTIIKIDSFKNEAVVGGTNKDPVHTFTRYINGSEYTFRVFVGKFTGTERAEIRNTKSKAATLTIQKDGDPRQFWAATYYHCHNHLFSKDFEESVNRLEDDHIVNYYEECVRACQ